MSELKFTLLSFCALIVLTIGATLTVIYITEQNKIALEIMKLEACKAGEIACFYNVEGN